MVSDALIEEILLKKFGENTVDIVTGGAPCESFSLVGQRKEDDKRNDLFSNILRIAHAVESKFVLFENVPVLLTKKRDGKNGGQISYVFDEFKRPNPTSGNHYILASKETNTFKCLSADYGTPQKRERLFIIGCNSKYGANPFVYPEKTHGPNRKYPYITVEDAFRYLPEIDRKEGTEEMPYSPTFEEDYKNGLISEAVYLYFKFLLDTSFCGNKNYKPGIITYHKVKACSQQQKGLFQKGKKIL